MLSLHRNENSFGLSPSVRTLLQTASHSAYLYPDAELEPLVRQLAARLRLRPSQVFPGAGATAQLDAALGALAGVPGMRLFCSRPVYAPVVALARRFGLDTVEVPFAPGPGVDLDAMVAAVATHAGPAVVYLSRPDCHSGELIDRDRLVDWIAGAGARVRFIVDEAYIEFVPAHGRHSLAGLVPSFPDRLLVLRSFSKAYGLAGLRIGYALGGGSWQRVFADRAAVSPVNLLGVRAAYDALDDDAWLEHSLTLLDVSRGLLCNGLAECGVTCVAGHGNFVLHTLPVDDRRFCRMLSHHGIRVAYPIDGLPGWCRVTVGTLGEITYYLNALQSL